MAGVFDLELHDTPEGDEEISDDEYFEPDSQVTFGQGSPRHFITSDTG